MIETVFVIKAHNDPRQLGRLLRRLDVPWAASVVHLDKRVWGAAFFNECVSVKNLTLIPKSESVPIYWGGYSNAQATLLSLGKALRTFPHASRFFMLSGADYPAVSMEAMRSRWKNDLEYVRVDRRLGISGDSANDYFVKRRYLGDNKWANERDAKIPGLGKLAKVASRLLPLSPPEGFEIYHGSDWYGLTAAGVRTILDFYKDRPDILSFFRKVRSPVEMIVQSALMASPLYRNIADASILVEATSSSVHVRGSHYIDWSLGGSHPRSLTLSDWWDVKHSGVFFLRKVDPLRSAGLLDTLDSEAHSTTKGQTRQHCPS